MNEPDPETQRQLIRLGLEGLERILRERLAEARLTIRQARVLGFWRGQDDHLHAIWDWFDPDIKKHWQGLAP